MLEYFFFVSYYYICIYILNIINRHLRHIQIPQITKNINIQPTQMRNISTPNSYYESNKTSLTFK